MSPPREGPELLRRGLLGLVTALVVARPLVAGEDPGMLDPQTGASGLVLTLLWLLAAVGWAVWRAWARRGVLFAGLVEAGLLVIAFQVFASAGRAAHYQHPAWL